ncbi:C2H2 finger domain protein, putative [Talaromyces stipitatus ATCC 10500]|uniref:C2H2 finger domain protein, putative n=1 Tax=Talaromyces stipitatus (strain ATCC 10500 / CBS 375.48 / QM 6759 / NRRL 1006) TaxID=441959 RepID=B8ML01_TALSN|nr:C2H2 finger domain protein, putative [Talaromyces stipitatus ATCC 10500]EED15417.1 C2H2 finger domain protein, putative [Talaromyces stipitatus ATCC 10500]
MMKVSNLVSTEWSEQSGTSSQPHLSPAPSLSGSVRKYDEYCEKPSPITTAANTSYFSVVNSNKTTTPQLPLSPPADDQRKCSLPSISSLLEGMDSMPANKRARHDSGDYSRNFFPPTPPMRPCSGFTEGNSPASLPSGRSHSASVSSTVSHQPPQRTSLPSISASLQNTPVHPPERLSISSLASPDSARLPHAIPSPSSTTTSITTATQPTPYYTTLEEKPYPRAHSASAPVTPSSLVPPPPPPPAMLSPVNHQGWQHHHYFPLSTTTPFPPNHERYICRTCHKAFSRPSSLRIHSHSHTGEKPFRCTHAGCGKAFSVRSNMKRHERGCHSGRPMTATVV